MVKEKLERLGGPFKLPVSLVRLARGYGVVGSDEMAGIKVSVLQGHAR